MIITDEIIKTGQDALISTFEQDGYSVIYSETICDIHRCTGGNTLKCTDGKLRRFRRYIDTRRKIVYWCYA